MSHRYGRNQPVRRKEGTGLVALWKLNASAAESLDQFSLEVDSGLVPDRTMLVEYLGRF